MNEASPRRSAIVRDELPERFPTHAHSPQFWEQLGRTVATFGFLEEILGKAIFALTATRYYKPDQINAAYEAWLPQLERALTDQLKNLAESFGRAARLHPDLTTTNIDELVQTIKDATPIRNVLCHGSWRTPDLDGASVPFFVNRQMQIFDSPVDIAYFERVQAHVVDIICGVINSVTHIGLQLPGSNSPGMPIHVNFFGGEQ